MLSHEEMIPEMLRRLQTTGEEALGKLDQCKDKREEVVAWCGTGMEILSEYLNRHESFKLLSQAIKATQTATQQTEKEDFGHRLQEISSCLVSDVKSIA